RPPRPARWRRTNWWPGSLQGWSWSWFALTPMRSYAAIESAAEIPTGVEPRGIDRGEFWIRDDKLRRAWLPAITAAVLPGEGLIAQRELQAIVGGGQTGLFERALQLRLLALQKLQRIGAVDRDMGGDLAVAVDVKAHVDAAELRRIEPDIELVGAGARARGDFDRKARDGNGGRKRCGHACGRRARIRRLNSEVWHRIRRGGIGGRSDLLRACARTRRSADVVAHLSGVAATALRAAGRDGESRCRHAGRLRLALRLRRGVVGRWCVRRTAGRCIVRGLARGRLAGRCGGNFRFGGICLRGRSGVGGRG